MTKDADAVLVDRETHPAPEISPRASCEMLPTSAVRSFPAVPDQQADQNDRKGGDVEDDPGLCCWRKRITPKMATSAKNPSIPPGDPERKIVPLCRRVVEALVMERR